jgi:hypothetical protein
MSAVKKEAKFLKAVREGDVETVIAALDRGVSTETVSPQDLSNSTPLFIAIEQEHEEVFK